jgi:hypothetical protein
MVDNLRCVYCSQPGMVISHGEVFGPDIIMLMDSRTLPNPAMATGPLSMALATSTS